MAKAIQWTDGQDFQIKRMRSEGSSWDVISGVLAISRYTVIERGRAIGAARGAKQEEEYNDAEREPLAAGSSATWNAINEGLSIAGAPYPLAAFVEGTCRIAA